VALNPATHLSSIEYIIEDLDFILVMSVNPGFGGQKFISATVEKIRRIKELCLQRGVSPLIEVDGGINTDTISYVTEAGADVCVAGSAVFDTEDYGMAITSLKKSSTGKDT
jgi:ribulose-phosphate 3-epimerase